MTPSTTLVKLMYTNGNLPPGHTFDDVLRRGEEFKRWYEKETARTVTVAELEVMSGAAGVSVTRLKTALAAIDIKVIP